jgi:uncharacterized membrane protein
MSSANPSDHHKPDHELVFHPPAWLKRIGGPLASRPRLVAGLLVGVLVGVALSVIPNHLRPSTRALFAWDAGVAVFCVSMLMVMAKANDRTMRVRACVQDEGQHVILGLVLVAAVISIGAIAKELSLAKADKDLVKVLRIGLAFATVIASWFLVQLIFALHYAHEYYSPAAGKSNEIAKGLVFPDDDTPDYWDFLYFSVVIGVASQTADVSFKTKALRRIGTVHGVTAFTFNTVVLALTINLLAGLF